MSNKATKAIYDSKQFWKMKTFQDFPGYTTSWSYRALYRILYTLELLRDRILNNNTLRYKSYFKLVDAGDFVKFIYYVNVRSIIIQVNKIDAVVSSDATNLRYSGRIGNIYTDIDIVDKIIGRLQKWTNSLGHPDTSNTGIGYIGHFFHADFDADEHNLF